MNIKHNLQQRCGAPNSHTRESRLLRTKNGKMSHTHTHTNECAPCEYGGGKKSHGKKFIGSGICFDNNLLLLLWFRFTIQSANYAENLILCLCMWPHGARGKDMHITQLIFRRQTQNLKLS